jgi:hypothetical protein
MDLSVGLTVTHYWLQFYWSRCEEHNFMARLKHTTLADVKRQREREMKSKPPPAQTSKGTSHAIINTMRDKGYKKDKKSKKDGSVPTGLVEVLQQIQCSLGSLDRAVKSQAEKVVEIESRMERKRGAEITCKVMVHDLHIVVNCLFSAQGKEDNADKRKKAKGVAGTANNANFRYTRFILVTLSRSSIINLSWRTTLTVTTLLQIGMTYAEQTCTAGIRCGPWWN